jgi:hypothetical protein
VIRGILTALDGLAAGGLAWGCRPRSAGAVPGRYGFGFGGRPLGPGPAPPLRLLPPLPPAPPLLNPPPLSETGLLAGLA